MALAQYSELFWFPSGELAASVPARVFVHNANTLATLYADAGGTTPLANPVSTSGTGRLEFWAEEGRYWVHIDSEAFEIAVGAAAQGATQQDIATHAAASDPHGDRAYAGATFATIVTVTALTGDVQAIDGFVNDLLTRVQAIEQGTAFLAGGNFTAPLLVLNSRLEVRDGSGNPLHRLDGNANTAGFFGATPVGRQSVSGSWADGSAGVSLAEALATLGLITDNSTP
ncbi:hypothetical protein [Streptomyces sp. NPDC093591]|uniref:hypothetical protein n=1 Tax=Streptomyces sp. NPDC093591 TaxID=3366044 RepID=UPI00382ED77A